MKAPRIEFMNETMLVGKQLSMSFSENKTHELWRNFGPLIKQIKNRIGSDLYSVEIYSSTDFFREFNPTTQFNKWAAVKVEDHDSIPAALEPFTIPEGQYAVFHYKGKPSEAQGTFQYIFNTWLPESKFQLDHRPHFVLMGEKYIGEDPDSEEEFYVPIKKLTLSL